MASARFFEIAAFFHVCAIKTREKLLGKIARHGKKASGVNENRAEKIGGK